MPTIFSDFLTELRVPHTDTASDKAFNTMPFQSLFGFSRLLESYDIATRGLALTDKTSVSQVPVPFLAQKKDAFVIVTGFDQASATVDYIVFNEHKTEPFDRFINGFTGVILQAFPNASSCEPGYSHNRLLELIAGTKKVMLWLCAALLIIAGVIHVRLWQSPSTLALLGVDIAGIAVTWLLILKSLKVRSKSADRICAIIREHGCDSVLEQKAATFYGIVSWSEVGIAYFVVSTLILLLFPGSLPLLAVVNVCCLPFTVWSICYQRFRLHTWCTLCVTTQLLLWLQFGTYLWSGAWSNLSAISIPALMAAAAAYIGATLGANRIMNFIKSR